MFGIEVRSTSLALAIAFAMALGPAQAAEPGSTGSKFPHPAASTDTAPDVGGLRQALRPDSAEPGQPIERRDVTGGALEDALTQALDRVKQLGWKRPGAKQKPGFDVSVEFHGLGLQFEEQGTYGYVRPNRAFSRSNSVGIQFRYRF